MTFSIRLQQSKLQPLLILVLFSLVQVCGTIEKELGKAGETTRYLQLQSETKIRVTRDNGAELLVDQRSSGGGITCFAQSFFV